MTKLKIREANGNQRMVNCFMLLIIWRI